jgi:hypothetical protein
MPKKRAESALKRERSQKRLQKSAKGTKSKVEGRRSDFMQKDRGKKMNGGFSVKKMETKR